MTDVPISKLISVLVILVFSVFAFSCSDSSPDVTDVTGFIVLDYKSADSVPEVRLAAFAETSSQVQRVEKISVKNRGNSFEWSCLKPQTLTDDKKKWAGYSDFIVPEGQLIPDGIYDLTYTDAQEKSVSKQFYIDYDKKLLKTKASKVESLLSENKTENICAYSDKGTLLYFGQRNPDWKEDSAVFTFVKDSCCYRICWIESGKSVYCLMPPVYKTDNKSENK